MKKTKFILSRLLPGLGFWVFCLMLFSSDIQVNAQTSSPLPQFKPRAEVMNIVNLELETTLNAIKGYGTDPANRPVGNPAYDRLVTKYEAVKSLMDFLGYQDMSVEQCVTSIYPMLAPPRSGGGVQQVVNLEGFQTGNWPADFRDLVNKIKI